MTIGELRELGIPLPRYEQIDVLYVESALQWIRENTTLEFDVTDLEEIEALPSGAKLFVVKFRELMSAPIGVTSESVDGLSQSFSDSLKKEKLLDYANELMGEYVSQVQFVPTVRKWSEWA